MRDGDLHACNFFLWKAQRLLCQELGTGEPSPDTAWFDFDGATLGACTAPGPTPPGCWQQLEGQRCGSCCGGALGGCACRWCRPLVSRLCCVRCAYLVYKHRVQRKKSVGNPTSLTLLQEEVQHWMPGTATLVQHHSTQMPKGAWIFGLYRLKTKRQVEKRTHGSPQVARGHAQPEIPDKEVGRQWEADCKGITVLAAAKIAQRAPRRTRAAIHVPAREGAVRRKAKHARRGRGAAGAHVRRPAPLLNSPGRSQGCDSSTEQQSHSGRVLGHQSLQTPRYRSQHWQQRPGVLLVVVSRREESSAAAPAAR